MSLAFGADITALWVRSALPHYPGDDHRSQRRIRGRRGLLCQARTRDRPLLRRRRRGHFVPNGGVGHPAQTLLTVAKEEAVHLIVVGSRGHSGLWDRMLGHTADRISEAAPCSVLIAR